VSSDYEWARRVVTSGVDPERARLGFEWPRPACLTQACAWSRLERI